MEIKIETGGLRLDKALSDLTELSRSLANEQIKSGQVLVNGQVKKAKYTVQEGDIVTYHVPEPEVLEYVPENLPLDIIYQDEDVAVVNKPQGMVMHPSAEMCIRDRIASDHVLHTSKICPASSVFGARIKSCCAFFFCSLRRLGRR